jgi:WD40 repeat protein
LASGSVRTAWVWDLDTSQPVQKFKEIDGWIGSVFFSPAGSRLITVGVSPTVWDLSSGKAITEFGKKQDAQTSAALSPDGKQLALGFLSGDVTLWDVSNVVAD